MTAPSRRIVFLGTHGQYNIGDELLLETFLTQLGTQHRYLVNSYDPDFTRGQLRPRFDVEVIDTGADRCGCCARCAAPTSSCSAAARSSKSSTPRRAGIPTRRSR